MSDECIFCKIVEGEVPAKVVFRNERVLAFEDIRPVAPVHLLIIPAKHIPSIRDLEPSDYPLLHELVDTANNLAREREILEPGFRLNINAGPNGGQTVYHLHVHLLGGRFMTWPPG